MNGTETWQVYGFGGELLAEYPASGAVTTPQKEYGYRNGQLLATAASARLNVAAAANGSTATASETHSAPYAPSGPINGDRKLYTNNAWANVTATYPQWLQVDFGGSRTIDEVDVFSIQDNPSSPSEPTLSMTFNNYGITAFQVQYWNGSSWVTVPNGQVTGNNKVWKQITFAPITTSKIKVVITGTADGYSRLAEVEAWGNAVPTPRANVAASSNGGTATASETHSAPYAPSGAINGDRKFYTNNAWANVTATYPQWLQVDFNGSKVIDEVDVFSIQDNFSSPSEPTLSMTFNNYGVTAFQVQYWNGSSWLTVPNGQITGNNKVWKRLTFSPITTTKIKVVINGTADGYSRLAEVEAWGIPAGSVSDMQWLISDHLGTPRMVLDQTGTLANMKRHDYLPFGEELFPPSGGRTAAQGYAGGDGIRQQFTQKERDIETGLDYFQARYVSPVQGRFTSTDPENAGADVGEPQSWNGYAYCLNNPLRFIDPDGLRWAQYVVDGAIHYEWFDDQEKDQNGQTAYDRAIAAGWAAVKFNESKNYTYINGLIAPGEQIRVVTLTPDGQILSNTHLVTWSDWARLAYVAKQTGYLSDRLVQDFFISRFADGMDAPAPAPEVPIAAMGGRIPSSGLQMDATGKVHGPLPKYPPKQWTRQQLEESAAALRQSIANRKAELLRLGEHGPHRARIGQEERLLRQIVKKLSGS